MLAAALARDGPATSAELGPLAAAWTPEIEPPAGDVLCLIDGHPLLHSLAGELGLDPVAPAGNLLAAGYRALGEEVVERLGGEFAVLIWDGERSEGVVARDRLGARPLFVAEHGGALLFGSEVRILLAVHRATPSPDPLAITRWLARTNTDDPRTLYSGIERLPAGHLLTLGRNGGRRRRYWEPRYTRPRHVPAGEAAADVRERLGRAVARSLEGARAPAVMLSGGFDSATVAAVGRTHAPGLSAYSAVFPDDVAVDESASIERVREYLRLPGAEERFGGGSALAAAAEFTRAWELPSLSPNLFVWLPLLRRAAADGVDVVIDGEGGDELFGCARYLIADRVRSGRALAATRTARRLPGMGSHPRPRWIRRAVVAYGVRGALPAALHERLRRARGSGIAAPEWLSAEAARTHRAEDDPWRWKRMRGPRWWAELSHTLTRRPDSLGAADQFRRAGQLAGVELRHPLRDPELVALMLSLPPELGFDPRVDRPLARRALAGSLPEETLRDEHKPTFDSLPTRALGGPDAAALRDLARDPHPELASRVRDQ